VAPTNQNIRAKKKGDSGKKPGYRLKYKQWQLRKVGSLLADL
jgi:hypothetical protein